MIPATPRRAARLVPAGLAAAAVASAATTTIAAVGSAGGISLGVSGAPIPVLGFAVLTALCSVIGLALALVLARLVRHPRRSFVHVTVVLTTLSLIPDVAADAAPSTKLLLMLTHLVAAAIVVPALARRLPAGQQH
ncbi:hypothetical protein DQ239_16920 [Blastococcus sp. TF02-09]|nr:hypothetical protein DQ239_16920 [Blastococcus sp. TF02-9]